MKINSEKLKFLVLEIEALKKEHPKAEIYYDSESDEIRITYPLPKDFSKFKPINIYPHDNQA